MTSPPPTPTLPPPDLEDPSPPTIPAWQEFARAPLVPVAVAALVGLIADRYLSLAFNLELLVAAAGCLGWFAARSFRPELAPLALWLGSAGIAAAYHHSHRNLFAPDDVGTFATSTPVVAKIRGVIDEPPTIRRSHRTDLYGPARRTDKAITVLVARELAIGELWQPASGRLRVSVERVVGEADAGYLDTVRLGDEVEVVGQFYRPSPPANPGEPDYAAHLLDQRIRAELRVAKGAEGVTRIGSAGQSPAGAVVALRTRLTRFLDDSLLPREAGLARALLLGDGTAMDRDEWDAFTRTGVVHVLAISGQHLVILAGFVWFLLRAGDIRRRHGIWLVMALIVGYAVLTGLKPSAVRATVMVCGMCIAVLLQREPHPANVFALAGLVVIAFDPTDPFTAGCQLSFVAVFVLIWGAKRWLTPHPPTPLERLIDESRPGWLRLLRAAARFIFVAYAVTLILTIVTVPIIMLQQNLITPVGVLIGPPLILLTAAALLVGFLALLVGLLSPPLAAPLATITGWLLAACDAIVRWADAIPGGSIYVPGPPVWWAVGFYALLVVVVLADGVWRRRAGLALAAWTIAGLVGGPDTRGDELRVTFLAVGHGGCTVLECPDGRVIVYDAGTMAGSDAVRRTIAPFLWHRGLRRVDELVLSHADLDHYNGVTELLRRFPVARVTLTPSFAQKPTPEVADVLLALDQHRVERRIVHAGYRFTAGAVEFEVLHPPRGGPSGSENERSLVVSIRHAGHTILLTGDLEKEGTAHVLSQPPQPVDVMMAPHHGSRAAFPAALRVWASPRLLVACRGQREGALEPRDTPGADLWDTWTHGAITLRSNPTGLTAETFRTNQRLVIRRGR